VVADASGDVDPIDAEAAVVQLQRAVAAVDSAQALRQYLDSIVVNPDRSVRVDGFGAGVTLGV
jgi:hypothetical protein